MQVALFQQLVSACPAASRLIQADNALVSVWARKFTDARRAV
jgi:hypothetical protein